jgi:hypothetical protein
VASEEDVAAGEPAVQEFLFDSPLIRRHADLSATRFTSFPRGRPVLAAGPILPPGFSPTSRSIPRPPRSPPRSRMSCDCRRGVCQDFAQFPDWLLAIHGTACSIRQRLSGDRPRRRERRNWLDADASQCLGVLSIAPGSAGLMSIRPTTCFHPNVNITTAWGRDYSDVSPIRGVILGAGEHELNVSVTSRRSWRKARATSRAEVGLEGWLASVTAIRSMICASFVAGWKPVRRVSLAIFGHRWRKSSNPAP